MKTDCELAARVAAVASAGAGLIHLAVMPMHWREWWLSGLFFLSVAFFQIAWGFLGWKRPTGWVLAAGIVGNATVVTLWVVSRTAGMPFGPDAGNVEVVEAAGICALLLECYVVMASAWSWSQGANAEPVSALGGALVLVGANTVIIGAVAGALVVFAAFFIERTVRIDDPVGAIAVHGGRSTADRASQRPGHR